jgi:hypothetical protein
MTSFSVSGDYFDIAHYCDSSILSGISHSAGCDEIHYLHGYLIYAMILKVMYSRKLVLLFLVFSIPIGNSYARGFNQSECDRFYSWGEINTEYFAIVYSTANIGLAQSIVSFYGEILDEEYEQFSSAFSENLVTPISIRIYPQEQDYYCLNALAPILGGGATHSRIGSREISLIAENIHSDYGTWGSRALNDFRHELIVLFGVQLSQGKIPEGLLKGLGGYGENPAEVFEDWYQTSGNIFNPEFDWQILWDTEYAHSDKSRLLQTTSIVAYLIDVFGWNSFVDFLRNLASADGHRQALIENYAMGFQSLQSHWRDYFTVYVTDRWQFNVFHNYDLGVIMELMAAGAYVDAANSLEEAITVIEIFGEEENLSLARELLERSQKGIQAGAFVGEARQALIAGEYQRCVDISNQALGFYEQLGDNRRISEIEAYITVAQEVLDLRREVEQMKLDVPYPAQVERLIKIGHRLSELGDGQGVTETEISLATITGGQRKLTDFFFAGGGLMILVLLIRRFFVIKRAPPPEADLL